MNDKAIATCISGVMGIINGLAFGNIATHGWQFDLPIIAPIAGFAVILVVLGFSCFFVATKV